MRYKCSYCGHEFDEKEAINVTHDKQVAFCPYFFTPTTLEEFYGYGMIGTCGYEAHPIEKEA